jgi:hypothetical protein
MQQVLGGPAAAPTNAAQFVPLEPATLSEIQMSDDSQNLATHPSVTWA